MIGTFGTGTRERARVAIILGALAWIGACSSTPSAPGSQPGKDAGGYSPDAANPSVQDASEPPADTVTPPAVDAPPAEPPATDLGGGSDSGPPEVPVTPATDAGDAMD